MGALDGKTALVTGGSRGIGRAIVERLAEDGASVMFSFAQNEAAANDVVANVRGSGGHAFATKADQGRRRDIERLFDEAEQRLNGLDILVINAAVVVRTNILDATESEYDQIMAVNTKGSFFAIQLAGKRLRDNGRIINISTLATVRPLPIWPLYVASKAAVEQFVKAAARELGRRGITVNSVSPGATRTDSLIREQPPEKLDQFVRLTALRRLGEPADIANVVAFLAGSDSQWITGQNLQATGGLA